MMFVQADWDLKDRPLGLCQDSTQSLAQVCLNYGQCLGLNSIIVDDPSFSTDFFHDRLLNLLDLLGLLDPADGGVFDEDDNHD